MHDFQEQCQVHGQQYCQVIFTESEVRMASRFASSTQQEIEKLLEDKKMCLSLSCTFLAELRRPQRAAKRSPIIIEKGTTRMHRNRNPCNSFLWSNWLAAWITGACAQRRRRRTTTNDVAQHGGHPANTKSCSLGLQH